MALQRVSSLPGHVVKRNFGDEGMVSTSIVDSVLHALGTFEEYNSGNNNNSSIVAHHHGSPHTYALTSEGNDHFVRHNHRLVDLVVLVVGRFGFYIQLFNRFADLASTFNWAALALVLGSYGLVLSNPLFWMCWIILVIKAVIYNSEESEESEGTTRPHFAGAIILKLGMSFALITLLLWTEETTKRQDIMLFIIAVSVLLFEGVSPLLREGLSWRRNQTLKVLIFFIPSALNAMMSMTGPIVFGGDLGRLMRKEALLGFTLIFLVDVLAEIIPPFVFRRRFPLVMSEDLPMPKTHHVVVMLRTIVEGYLCWWMGKVIYQVSYFPSNLDIDNCNKLCQERSKHLLITMVVLGGLQVAGTFIAYFFCCLLVHRHDPTLPS